MTAREFVSSIPDFHSLAPIQQIRLFAWFLHHHDGAERFDNEMIRECFRDADLRAPDVSVYIPRLADKKRGDFLKDARGYRLAGPLRQEYDEQYGQHPTTIAVTKLLTDLPPQLPHAEQKEFLDEALNCYRVRAFRASIVMAWNLAYDHLLRWLMADMKRLADFNTAIGVQYPKYTQRIGALVDFEKFKENEILTVLRSSKLVPKNIVDILDEKLKRRNAAAHPSRITIDQPQADVVILDLVKNVVLLLK
jgi:hypothetical protein